MGQDKLMNEVILYGGFPVTRANVYRIALEDLKDRKGADYIAFGATHYEVLPEGSAAMSIEEFRYATTHNRLPKGWYVPVPKRLKVKNAFRRATMAPRLTR